MTILLGLIAQLQLVDGLYHIIAKDQEEADRRSFELKDKILPFSTLSTPSLREKQYLDNRQEFDDYLFPDTTESKRVRILTLPMDRELIRGIVSDLLTNYSGFDERKKRYYEQCGFIDGYETGWDLTENGRGFLKAIKPALDIQYR